MPRLAGLDGAASLCCGNWWGAGDGGRGFKEGDRASRFWRGVGLQLRREERLRRTTAGDLPLGGGGRGRKLSLGSMNPFGGNPWRGTECGDGSRFY